MFGCCKPGVSPSQALLSSGRTSLLKVRNSRNIPDRKNQLALTWQTKLIYLGGAQPDPSTFIFLSLELHVPLTFEFFRLASNSWIYDMSAELPTNI